MPNRLTAVGEALAAAADFLAAGFPVVDRATLDARLDICRGCEWLRPADWVCRECSCYLVLKARMATADCGLKKWPRLSLEMADAVGSALAAGQVPPQAPGCCG